MRVGVLVEHPLSRPRAHRLGLRGIVEQRTVGSERLSGVLDDHDLLPRLEPLVDTRVGFETIAAPAEASSNGRHVDEPARSRASAASR